MKNFKGKFLIDPLTKDYLISPSLFKSLATLDDGEVTVQWYTKDGVPAHKHQFSYRRSNVGNKFWQELTENHNHFMNFTVEVNTK